MTIRRLKTAFLTGALALGVAAHVDAQPVPQERLTLAMPSMPLGDALRQIARLSGRSLVVDDALVAGRKAPALSGQFSAAEALRRLLAGSGLATRTEEGTIIVSRFRGDLAANDRSEPKGGEEIVVTGTHVRGAPSTSPVILLTRKAIDASGVTSVEDLMRHLPENLSAGVGSQNFLVVGTGQLNTQFGAGINLRGLGQRATLVLINGRRVAPSDDGSFVDVSLIPVTAIDRVEVLTDGASAIYGSDAVGGVVNFVLRNDFKGIEQVVQAGTTTGGGGRQFLAGLTAGTRWSGGNALLSYEYRDENPVQAKDRDFTINLPPYWNLTPKERRHSLFGTLRQDLSSSVAMDISGMYAVRHTQRNYVDASRILMFADAHAISYGGTAELQLKPGGSWLAAASASYFRTRTRETTTKGNRLYQLGNMLNEFGELALRADGNLLSLPGGDAKLALGAGIRRENFRSLYESSVNSPTATRVSRAVSSAYGELNIPLVSALNSSTGFRLLTLSAAGRFEHYERIGSTFNPKFGVLWSPIAGLSLRGSYGTSFRAPLLYESSGLYVVFLEPAAGLYQDPSQAVGVGAIAIGNNPNMRPERSNSLSLGVEIVPPQLKQFRFSANYYKVQFIDRIALPILDSRVIGIPAFASLVTLNPSVSSVERLLAGAFQVLDVTGPNFTPGSAKPSDVAAILDARTSNTAETRTSGLDLLVHYDFSVGRDEFGVELNANKVFRFDDKLTSTSLWIQRLNTPFSPVDFRARGGLSWRRGPVSAVAFVNYTGPYSDNRGTPVVPIQSFTTVDAGVALDGSSSNIGWLKHVRVALNAQNLFDARPPHLAPDRSTRSKAGVGYDPVNASGVGRFISLQLRSVW